MKKIEFTKDQFKDLLELVYLGEHMANAHRVNDTIEKYRDLFHHIFEHAADYGQQDSCIPFDPLDSDPRVYPNADFEADTREFVEEYDENTFSR